MWLVISWLIFRYYHGPTPIQSLQYATSQDIINSFQSIRQEMEAYTPRLTQVGDLYSLKNRIPSYFLWAHSYLPYAFKIIFTCLAELGLGCGIWALAPWPGIKRRPFALGLWNLGLRTTREVPSSRFLIKFTYDETHRS